MACRPAGRPSLACFACCCLALLLTAAAAPQNTSLPTPHAAWPLPVPLPGDTRPSAHVRRQGRAPCPAPHNGFPICWSHVPKTGGTELTTALEPLMSHVVQRVGHFCNCFERPEPLRVVLLRDPLERLWSSYFNQKQTWDSAPCREAWDGVHDAAANCSSLGSCAPATWAAAQRLRPCGCCGLPSDLAFGWSMKHDPALHGYLSYTFLRSMLARSAARRQLAFLGHAGVHNIIAQTVLSPATLDACFADLQSARCGDGIAADLSTYSVIGFTSQQPSFQAALIELACSVARGERASACRLGGRAVSAEALRVGERPGCCWVGSAYKCGAPECSRSSWDEAISPDAQRLAAQLNALDIKLYQAALALANGSAVVVRPPGGAAAAGSGAASGGWAAAAAERRRRRRGVL